MTFGKRETYSKNVNIEYFQNVCVMWDSLYDLCTHITPFFNKESIEPLSTSSCSKVLEENKCYSIEPSLSIVDKFCEKCKINALSRVVHISLINIFRCNLLIYIPLLIIFNWRYYSIFLLKMYRVPKKNGHLKCIGNHVKNGKTVCNFVQLVLKHSFLFYYVRFGFHKL